MRKRLCAIGLGLAAIAVISLGCLDTYIDMHPEILKQFVADHPAFFPVNPWLAYGAAAIMTLMIALVLWRLHKRFTKRDHD